MRKFENGILKVFFRWFSIRIFDKVGRSFFDLRKADSFSIFRSTRLEISIPLILFESVLNQTNEEKLDVFTRKKHTF